MTLREKKTPSLLNGAAAYLMVCALLLLTWHNAHATPAFAKETEKACSQCHVDPKGGGALTPFGTQFKASGNKMPAKANEPPPAKPAT